MKKFFIITNHIKDPELKTTYRIREMILEKQGSCQIHDSAEALSSEEGFHYTDPSIIPEGTECILVLGGDGTLLNAARDLKETSYPLLGINLGTLGYLAEIEVNAFGDALERLMNDQYTVEPRMMLHGKVMHGDEVLTEDTALNDIVIGRRGHLRVVCFNVYVKETFLCSYRADGVILSTATGSTGYSLSAGGPIVSPDADLILMTALAPHSLNSRTVVLPRDVTVCVELGEDRAGEEGCAEVTFDGAHSLLIRSGDRVIISRSEMTTPLVRVYHTSFVEVLSQKMKQ